RRRGRGGQCRRNRSPIARCRGPSSGTGNLTTALTSCFMPHLSDIVSAEDLARVGGLQLLARGVVEGFISGLHRSPHRGNSVEFKQHRSYVPGDDLRMLDWKIFGKTDRFFVREFEEETSLRATLLLDCSGSMAYGGEAGQSKHDYAVRLAACLGYLLLRQQDGVA